MSFDAMNLKPKLLDGIFGHGFEKPSAIQDQAIVPITTGKDVICQAQSGTGKTATFSIACLQRIDENLKKTQAIILAPTRELAQQSADVLTSIGSKMNIVVQCIIGGSTVQQDIESLNRNVPHVVVGTPGRLNQLITQGNLHCENVKMVIVDEADEMLKTDFQDQIISVFKAVSQGTQLVMVSATMPQQILDLTSSFMPDAIQILVKEDELTLDGIRQYQVALDNSWKTSTLFDIFKVMTVQQCIIFSNNQSVVVEVYEALKHENFACDMIHGKMDQAERNAVMKSFRLGTQRVLIATNVIARGIDVQNVSLVINYDIPKRPEQYLHRIGRSGRFGRKGVAINLVSEQDTANLQIIQDTYQTTIELLPAELQSLI
ncbi:Eukaryotic translation initiation factor 4A [Spironucleus salmonicida]|uniref:Eukaryotic translation initiation factor 4A n=1 Tax=Spironucleus salmonicida TaxID=348837 RepID=V6LU48_9EUKA|nr:Eukaryotic translation initiation factor 4A [Spironucleus salmonicida]|eukprot:EST47211.1 Eukaryotic translation initiation factor 4A [Spironucleus salmonicida]